MDAAELIATTHPWDMLDEADRRELAGALGSRDAEAGETIVSPGDAVDALFVVCTGRVQLVDHAGAALAELGPRGMFGHRALLGDGTAPVGVVALEPSRLLTLAADRFHAKLRSDPAVKAFFEPQAERDESSAPSLAEARVEALMARDPVTCPPDTPIADAAARMRDAGVGSILVVDGDDLAGILTIRDVAHRVVAGGVSPDTPVFEVMTRDPVTLPPDAIGSDVLHAIVERGIGHVPIAGAGGVVGIVTRTDLTRYQADSSADLVGAIAKATEVDDLAAVTRRIPRLLARLVGAGNRHEVVTRLVTDIADAVTRRLIAMAEAELGSPPVPYLWLACGSQGRREQTGVSDQDNCLFLDDAATERDDAYFADLARIVSEGLDRCGYMFCPGDMMATNPRWRQPVRVWRRYFMGWIGTPNPEAQMLASVMFDLRPIAGTAGLHADLQAETLEAASRNSIFVAHMTSNALKHQPPLGVLRGLATIRKGEHRRHLDMKMNGVVPVVDLARLYALRGRLAPVNTRARLDAAREEGVVSSSGGRDLLDAYDVIAETRLAHQARQVREGARPDNFLLPSRLSEFERSHLRDAFVVVRTMQSAATQGRGIL